MTADGTEAGAPGPSSDPPQRPPHAGWFVRQLLLWLTVAAAIFLTWRLGNVIVLVFGAVVVAVLLRSISEPIRDHTPLSDGLSVVAAILLILGLVAGAGWMFRRTMGVQFSQLQGILPHSLQALRSYVAAWPFGDQLVKMFSDGQFSSQLQHFMGPIGGYAMSAADAAVNAVIVAFVGVFLALEPRRSRNGFLILFPRGPRTAVAEAVDTTGRALRLWLVGMVFEMLTVGVLTGAGAWLVGLPTPLALGVIGGFAEIVPYVGPVISAVPGLLLALTLGWRTVLWTLLMYLFIHQVEGNLIYPFIQKRAANLPPALTLIAVLTFGVLLGPLGVILATPLLVVTLTATKLLYVRKALGEEVEIAGEKRPPPDAATR